MELQREHPGNYPHVHHVEADVIAVVHGEATYKLTTSFILGFDRIVENWSVDDIRTLGQDDIQPILELEPDVVLLGTGENQAFPSADVMAAFLKRGIGIEPMDNAAAARTHTILAGEDRRVVAAFIL
ncbi:MAG TPA: Mth938-like domain-containing protein [Rhodanobacteraceae bacterium]|nr:Mth938-like domain-containing protein [Rhodanobacteraceae bacterium]